MMDDEEQLTGEQGMMGTDGWTNNDDRDEDGQGQMMRTDKNNRDEDGDDTQPRNPNKTPKMSQFGIT
jgi:hypothetical protein